MYTKGKWRVEKSPTAYPFPYQIVTNKNIMARVHSEANAQLIAAAPLLYEACKKILEGANNTNTSILSGLDWEAIKQAIAKVEK